MWVLYLFAPDVENPYLELENCSDRVSFVEEPHWQIDLGCFHQVHQLLLRLDAEQEFGDDNGATD